LSRLELTYDQILYKIASKNELKFIRSKSTGPTHSNFIGESLSMQRATKSWQSIDMKRERK
jgi:hypothetical protein